MPQFNKLVIQNIAIIAQGIEDLPVGEAARDGFKSKPTNELNRLTNSIANLITTAKNQHQENIKTLEDQDTDYITRLSTNECFFYTNEPLALPKFEYLMNELIPHVKRSSGVQLILSSFAVKNIDNKVINTTVHIMCGPTPQFNFIIKNHTSHIDFQYKALETTGKTVTLLPFDKKTQFSAMPEIKLQGKSQEFTFDNIVHCRTGDYTDFLTAIEVCIDHNEGVAKANFEVLQNKKMNISGLPISQVIVSNTTMLNKDSFLEPAPMHVDTVSSGLSSGCMKNNSQKIIGTYLLDFGDPYIRYDVSPKKYTLSLTQLDHAYKIQQEKKRLDNERASQSTQLITKAITDIQSITARAANIILIREKQKTKEDLLSEMDAITKEQNVQTAFTTLKELGLPNELEQTIQEAKNRIDQLVEQQQEKFNHSIQIIYNQFQDALIELRTKLNQHDTNKCIKVLHVNLNNAAKELFNQLRTSSTKEQITLALQKFIQNSEQHTNAADAVMGHGWLYKTIEVIVKAILGLFVAIGMLIGSPFNQGWAKPQHRQNYVKTFFAFNKTEVNEILSDFKENMKQLETQSEIAQMPLF